ncbi:MAG: hypothetical protein KatS3mg118_2956 [Paracoccaceae bacterium]|nr:MAG: hypothetical protein KatS3mg118_2956 [Paracoccaceae bacterium]
MPRPGPRHVRRHARRLVLAALVLGAGLPAALAGDGPVGITPELHSVTIETPEGPVTIARIQDTGHVLTGEFARTSRPCPPFCIQPFTAAPGVTTIGELELIDMLRDPGSMVIDSRTADWHAEGTIPGARHLPWDQIAERLDALGCEIDFDGWDCSAARRVALFCNGAWCGQSPSAIRAMVAAGYPPDRIFWYRGGMQAWRMLGLTVIRPGG